MTRIITEVANIHEFVAESEEWKDFRRSGVTGTEIAALFDLNKYLTVHDLIKEKQGKAPPFTMNYYARMGHIFEPMNVMMVRRMYDLNAMSAGDSEGKVILLNLKDSNLLCSLDGVVKTKDSVVPLECKSTTYNSFHNTWKKMLPASYVLQVALQAICLNTDEGYVSLLVHQPPESVGFYDKIKLPIHVEEFHLYQFKGLLSFKEILVDEALRFQKAMSKKIPEFKVNTILKNKLVKLIRELDCEEINVE